MISAAVSTALGPAVAPRAARAGDGAEALTVADAARLVTSEGDAAWLDGVRRSGGRYVYRGVAGDAAARATLRRETGDLLDARTYGSAAAAAFFASLDADLAARGVAARPAVGHLATSDAAAAAAWGGAAASIWPLGKAAYCWLPDAAALWPAAGSPAAVARRLRVDEGLADAIAAGSEVLFVSRSFVAVPLALEPAFRESLAAAGRRPFSPRELADLSARQPGARANLELLEDDRLDACRAEGARWEDCFFYGTTTARTEPRRRGAAPTW